jgi:hypothetical protein
MPDAKIPQTADAVAPTNGTSGSSSKLVLPPADANIPSPPPGFVPTNGSDYFGLLPKKTEREAIADAVVELRQSPELGDIFGKTVPPVEDIADVFDAAQKWSSMRAQASKWDLYCRTQEGLAWQKARGMMGRVKPAFNLAVENNGQVGFTFPGLRRLLNAASDIAHRAVATKREKKRKAAEEAAAAKEGGGTPENQ